MMRGDESVGKNSAVFAGCGFTHDRSVLQPLQYRFCICRRNAMRPNHANH